MKEKMRERKQRGRERIVNMDRRMKEGKRIEIGERGRGRVEMLMAEMKEGMNDPDRLQCAGKGQGKCVRWSKLLPSSFPGAQIRLEVQPGPAAVHNGVLHPGLQAEIPHGPGLWL